MRSLWCLYFDHAGQITLGTLNNAQYFMLMFFSVFQIFLFFPVITDIAKLMLFTQDRIKVCIMMRLCWMKGSSTGLSQTRLCVPCENSYYYYYYWTCACSCHCQLSACSYDWVQEKILVFNGKQSVNHKLNSRVWLYGTNDCKSDWKLFPCAFFPWVATLWHHKNVTINSSDGKSDYDDDQTDWQDYTLRL